MSWHLFDISNIKASHGRIFLLQQARELLRNAHKHAVLIEDGDCF